MAKTVSVVAYRPEWPQMFEQERARIMVAVGPVFTAFEHMGSTAVPGLAAKPVIDMMPGVPSLATFDQSGAVAALEALGYNYRRDLETVMPERRYFSRNDRNPDHPKGRVAQLHVVVVGGAFWQRHLAFRDYLRAHPAERDAYGVFKQRIAPNYTDTNRYSEAKNDFIQAMQARALVWHASLNDDGYSGGV